MKLSIITVNLNNREGLKKTISSVVSQTRRDFEYLVIDGGSDDGSTEVIRSFEKKISKWISEKDEGIYEAMNKGISLSTGEYLLFLNSGDYLYQDETISLLWNELGSADIVYGDILFEEKNANRTAGYMPDKIDLIHMLRDTIWHPVAFIRRTLFEKSGPYDTSFRICGDYEFFFRSVIVNKVSTRHIKQFITVFDLKGISSHLQNHPRIILEKERVRKKYGFDRGIKPTWFNRLIGWFQ
jgi:glycosyltransferase involved in cell wall biosynthesis